MRRYLLITLILSAAAISFRITAQEMTVKDSDSNVLMKVNDEGGTGSISLESGSAPSITTGKLYNQGGSLYWSGNALGTSVSGGGWTDDGTVVRLSTGTDKVGIGDASPTHTLDVAGKIGINDAQVLYLPDQTNFTGTLIIGNGGGSLIHTTGEEGRYNTAVGIGALNATTNPQLNTAVGYRALYSNANGGLNTAVGAHALRTTTDGYNLVAVGTYALCVNTTGHSNMAIGYNALGLNTVGSFNTACGYAALYYNTEGIYNAAGGCTALHLNTTGNHNTAFGHSALYENTTGSNNTGVGKWANRYNQEGSNNTMIGYEAGSGGSVHNKSGNVFIGYRAGFNETGDNKLYIENSSSTSPLLWGDFSEDSLVVNGALNVTGTAGMTGFKMPTGASGDYVLTSDANGVGTWKALASLAPDGDWTISGSDMYSAVSGHVGVGTTSPATLLEVRKDQASVSTVRITNLNSGSGSDAELRLFVDTQSSTVGGDAQISFMGGSGAVDWGMGVDRSAGGKFKISGGGNSGDAQYPIGTNDRLVIDTEGKVGIGTDTPAGQLDVNGTIYQRGSEIHADYVFEDGYHLESIEEHAAYMWTNKHLKAVPKAEKDEAGMEIVEVGSHRKGIVEELEKAHIYIEQLYREIQELKAQK